MANNTVPIVGTACREFRGARNNMGYGVVRRQGRNWLLHRWIMYLAGHDIDGRVVMHRCDNPACFRYDHLAVGTRSDNTQDMLRKGRGRGNQLPNARRKLSHEQVRAARASKAPAHVVAEDFGVTASAIRSLRRGETYKEVSDG